MEILLVVCWKLIKPTPTRQSLITHCPTDNTVSMIHDGKLFFFLLTFH